MTTLERASREWSSRSPDERFDSLPAMHSVAALMQKHAVSSTVDDRDIHVTERNGDIMLKGAVHEAKLTNWSFGQLCREASAPASYVGNLPAKLAVECLNYGFTAAPSDSKTAILFDRRNGNLTARALNSEKYTRIWNADITKRLVRLEQEGPWQPAQAAFDGSRGLYLGDRDMFAFLVDNERRIFEKGPGGGLSRGFFCWNSEVGAASFGFMSFLYEYVCGNHRVWGATDVNEFRIRHVGKADEKGFAEFAVMLRKYADSSASEDEAKITAAREHIIGATKDEVLDAVFGLRIPDLSQTMIEAGYDRAIEHDEWYGNPRSAWGLAGGLTEIARDLPNADERVKLDRAAARVMEIAL